MAGIKDMGASAAAAATAKRSTTTNSGGNRKRNKASAGAGSPALTAAAAANQAVAANGGANEPASGGATSAFMQAAQQAANTYQTAPKISGAAEPGGAREAAAQSVANAAAMNTANQAQGAPASGYTPLGTYNDADLRANGQADPIDQYKAMYEQARLAGDQAGMQKAHALAEQYRAANGGYSGGADGSQRIDTPQNTPSSTWQVGSGFEGLSQTAAQQDRGIDSRLSETDYQSIQALKAQYVEHDRLYQQALAAGDTELANYYKNLRNQDHYSAEYIRNQYGYSGGSSGSDFSVLPQEQDIVPKQGLSSYQPQTKAVNDVYDALNQSTMAQLLASYNNAKSEMEYAMGKLPALYQQQKNATAANSEREKMAFREQAAASGLNYGNRSQAALAFANQLQNSLGQLNTAEANALADAQQQLTQLYTNYQQQIAQAVAENNYQRAAALLQEYRTAEESLVNTSLNQANMNLQVADFNRTTRQNNYQNSLDLANSLANGGYFGSLGSLGGLTADQINQLQRQYAVYQLGQYYPILRGYL